MSDAHSLSIEEMSTTDRLDRALDALETIDRGRLTTDVTLQEAIAAVRNVKRDIDECREYSARDCVHCGSPLTYRRADGDIGCKDCPGIMPRCTEVDR